MLPARATVKPDHEASELAAVDIRGIWQPTQPELNRRILKNVVDNFWKRNGRLKATSGTLHRRHSEQLSQAKLSKAFH